MLKAGDLARREDRRVKGVKIGGYHMYDQLSGHRLQQFLKNPLFSLFPIEKHKLPNLFVELESQMLHAKFQDHRTSGSGEDFYRFLPYMGVAAILVM